MPYYAGDPAGRYPLTPPEYHPAYTVTRAGDARLAPQLPYGAHSHLSAYPEKDGADRYGLPPGYAPSVSLRYPHGAPTAAPTYDAHYPSRYGHRQSMYGPVAAPVLPSLRANEATAQDWAGPGFPSLPELANVVESAPEEKPVGGVAAHLDYEMEQMSAFVAEMAQRMYDLYRSRICLADIDIARSVQSSAPVSPAFRKFVSQLLSSTRLPRSTIMLSLHYLAARMTLLSSREPPRTSSGQVYRMLTIALLLGSKFLDDNTFQNRSWSDVSGLPVAELNALEREWLADIDWNLHVDPLENQGLAVMSDRWRQWSAKAVAADAAQPTAVPRLAPIDTTVANPHAYGHARREMSPRYRYSLPSAKSLSHHGPVSARSGYLPPPTASYEHGWTYGRSQVEYSPPSAPETGPSTPDYDLYSAWSYDAAPPQYTMRQPSLLALHPPVYHHTAYPQPYPSNIWGGHRAGCACVYCARAHDPYHVPSGYGTQPVAG